MPKLLQKQKVSKRGTVVQYGSGSSAGSFFYRELIPGTSTYKTKKIDGAETLEEAVEMAMDIAIELAKEPDVSIIFGNKESSQSTKQRSYVTGKVIDRRPRKQLIADAVDRWVASEQRRADAGLIGDSFVNARRNGLSHVLEYLEPKGILWTTQINLNTFDEYPVFRASATPLVRKQELKWLKEFCSNYLVKNKLMSPELLLNKQFLPKVQIKQTDLLKNPAIDPDDWKVIVDFVRDVWRKRPLEQDNQSGWFFRNMFWHWILFAKNSGMSPEEILKMKWKQIEFVDVGRENSKGEIVSWEVAYVRTIRSKTQQAREIPVNQARELRRWKEWLDDFVKDFRDVKVTKDSYVFGDPRRHWTPYCYKHIGEIWREIRRELADKLKGHRFSPHPYTVYSMRSTFIEDHLLKGTPVIEVAEMAGHSIVETQRTYARLNLRKRAREITLPKLGNSKQLDKPIDLFDDDD